MSKTVAAGVIAAAFLLPLPEARAASVNLFTSAWFFGDSLTDDGNLFELTGGAQPPAPYFEGRSSNGPVWADHVAQDFDRAELPNQNFAYAFAQAQTNDDVALGRGVQISDLAAQIDRFAIESAGRLGSRPVAMVLIGANDIFTALATDPESAVATGAAAANAVADGLDTLAWLGVRDYRVFTLPPLGRAPAFLGSPAEPLADAATDSYNAKLAERLAGTPGVRSVDLHRTFLDLLADPAKFGLENVTERCFDPGVSPCGPEVADKYAFFDGVHPTAAVHTQIADLVRAEVAPVPLPSSLLMLTAGVAGLAVAGRRGRN
jgi:outer membrane lipase/esterase